MSNNYQNIRTIRDLLLAQFVGESYLEGFTLDKFRSYEINTRDDYDNSEKLTGRIALGANHFENNRIDRTHKKGDNWWLKGVKGKPYSWSATLATERMIDSFGEVWKVVDHMPNSDSGFSATLLKNDDEQYTLVFRSTESKAKDEGGDVFHDNNGANVEIASDGFAWGQIADMKKYFDALKKGELYSKEGSSKFDEIFYDDFREKGFKLNVVGYSLGSHLAQAFTAMHYDNVIETVVFNGAGIGKFDINEENKSDWENTGDKLNEFIPKLDERYSELLGLEDKEKFFDGLSEEEVTFLFEEHFPNHPMGDQERMKRFLLQEHRRAMVGKAEKDKNIYIDPLYTYAKRELLIAYPTTGSFEIGVKELLAKDKIVPEPKITNYYGHGDTNDSEFVAGAGIVYGSWNSIFIEDQVEWSKDKSKHSTLENWLFRSICPTHSIALIIDSLSVTEALMSLSPNTLKDRKSVEHLLFSVSTNERAKLIGSQAEFSSLERIVDGIGRIIFNKEWEDTPVERTKDGYADLYNRNALHNNIARLKEWADRNKEMETDNVISILPLWKSKPGEEVVVENFDPEKNPYHSVKELAADIAEEACNGTEATAYRYALKNLNPFVITGKPELYDVFNTSGELSNETWGENPQFVRDRADLLVLNMHLSMNNSGSSTVPSGVNYRDLARGFFHDMGKNLKILNTPGAESLEVELVKDDFNQIIFGTDIDDEISGGQMADRIYGQGGDDTIRGGGGGDTIVGGDGSDILYGGSGENFFIVTGEDKGVDDFHGGTSTDTILGGEGDDTIRVTRLSRKDNSIDVIDGGGGVNSISGTDSGDKIDLSGIKVSRIHELYGGSGEDVLIGSYNEERIYGVNMLESGSLLDDFDQDFLNGAGGVDTYFVGSGDTVADADNSGTIVFGGSTLKDLVFKQMASGSTVYTTADGNYSAILEKSKLFISKKTEESEINFTIQNYTSESAYGVILQEYEPSDESYDIHLAGTEDRDEMSILTLGDDPKGWKLVFGTFPQATGETVAGPLAEIHGESLYEDFLPESSPGMKITGSDTGDFLFGFAASDRIDGGGGDDIISGRINQWLEKDIYANETSFSDHLEGGDGNDWINGSGAADWIDGGADNDIIEGLSGNDHISGGTGNDVIAGGADDVVIKGEQGHDVLVGDGYITSDHNIDLDNLPQHYATLNYDNSGYLCGYTTVNFSVLEDVTNVGNDKIFGGDGDDFLSGGGGNDQLFGGNDQDFLVGGVGDDHVEGDGGNDLIYGDGADSGDASEGGNDLLYGGMGSDILYGQGGEDYLYGNQGEDSLNGGTGNDQLRGGTEKDELFGGLGDDLLWGGEHDDILYGDNNDDLGSGDDRLIGGTGNDSLYGEGGDDYLEGGVDRDILSGGSGNDILDGGKGDDLLQGGTGSDTYVFRKGDDNDIVEDSQGGDSVDVIRFDSVTSTSDITYKFATFNGSSYREDEHGNDLWISYFSDNVIIKDGRNATNFSYQLGSGSLLSKKDFFINIPSTHFIGTEHDDSKHGGEENDVYSGLEGNDSLYGFGGHDELEGGVGEDLLDGGKGDDVLIGGPGADVMIGGEGDDTFWVDDNNDVVVETGEGIDTIKSTVSYTLSHAVENLTLLGAQDIIGTGNTLDNRITGNAANNLLDGGQGMDVLIGGRGDDIYVVDNKNDCVIELAGEGTDTVRSTINYTLGQGFENLQLMGGNGIAGYGNDDANEITGNSGANVLVGGKGNDVLSGGSGDDTYLFNVGDGEDILTDIRGEGEYNHVVFGKNITPEELSFSLEETALSVWYTGAGDRIIFENVDVDDLVGSIPIASFQFEDGQSLTIQQLLNSEPPKKTLHGTNANDNLIGTDASETLTGFSGNDYLFGGLGNDQILGGQGRDVLLGGGGADFLDGGADIDIVSFLDSSQGVYVNLDNGIGRRGDAEGDRYLNVENIKGSTFADELIGTQGDNLFQGGDGDDIIHGLAGNDIFTDVTTIAPGEDKSGNDTYFGGAGDDKFYGMGGSDRLYGGEGNDSYYFNNGDGIDFIVDNEGKNSVFFNPSITLSFEEFEISFVTANSALTSYTLDKNGNDVLIKYSEQDGVVIVGGAELRNTNYTVSKSNGYFAHTEIMAMHPKFRHLKKYVGPGKDSYGAAVWRIDGTNSDDLLICRQVENKVYGKDGDDIIVGSKFNDEFIGGNGADVIDGADGIDTVSYQEASSGVEINLFEGGGKRGESLGDTFLDIENITGSEYEDILIGHDAKNHIKGGGGADRLIGLKGNDLLEGGAGADFIDGGEGHDSINFLSSEQSVTVDLGTGKGRGGDAEGDVLVSIEEITGSTKADFLTGGSTDTILHGHGGDDILTGKSGDDVINGDGGNDTLHGGTGNDILVGGEGDDTYIFHQGDGVDTIRNMGSRSSDSVVFGEGITKSSLVKIERHNHDLILNIGSQGDTLLISSAFSHPNNQITSFTFSDGNTLSNDEVLNLQPIYVEGLKTADILRGHSGVNHIYGYGGNDTIYALAGNDYVEAGDGDDLVYGHEGDDIIFGGCGTDNMYGGAGNDKLDGGEGNDKLFDQAGNNILQGGDGDDTLTASGDGNDELIGGRGDDFLKAKFGMNFLSGGEGKDVLIGGTGDDLLNGGVGADNLSGGDGIDTVDYSSSSVGVQVNLALNSAVGGLAEGDSFNSIETFLGSVVGDTFIGNQSDNTFYGQGGNDFISGGAGADRVNGGGGNDKLFGEDGDDILNGGDGNDRIDGGLGADTLSGGAGEDTFLFSSLMDQQQKVDIISDFTTGEDVFLFENDVFENYFTEGVLKEEHFCKSNEGVPQDEDDFFLYNSTSGALLYDADGTGQGVAIEVAKLTGNSELSHKDIMVAV